MLFSGNETEESCQAPGGVDHLGPGAVGIGDQAAACCQHRAGDQTDLGADELSAEADGHECHEDARNRRGEAGFEFGDDAVVAGRVVDADDEPVSERWFLEPGRVVEMRNKPLAAVVHFFCSARDEDLVRVERERSACTNEGGERACQQEGEKPEPPSGGGDIARAELLVMCCAH